MEENILIPEEHDGHRLRLRARIERSGFERMPPHQILEFLLYYAIPRQDVTESARLLLNHFGDLKKVLHATPEELDLVEGLGETALEWMKLVNKTVACCENIDLLPELKLKNYAQAFEGVPVIRSRFPDADMVQMCINAAGEACFYLPLKAKNCWHDFECMQAALRNAIMMHPESVLIMAFPKDDQLPEGEAMDRIQQYARTLSQSHSALSDIVLAAPDKIISMRQQNLISCEVPSERLSRLHEEYMRGMPSSEEVRWFPISKPEDKNEPV